MRKVYNIVAAALLAAIISSCAEKKQVIVVTNDSELSRENETVEVLFKTLQDGCEGLTAENVVILDSEGKQVPSQVYTEADGTVKLLFQASVESGASAEFKVEKGTRENYPMLAYSRHVPERKDDYAYENNKVAGRVYGPVLDFPRTFGSDIWLKSTESLVIDKRYHDELVNGLSYHINHGDGMDCYKVGPTLGGGALVPYVEGKLILGDNWKEVKHICDGPVRTKAVFTYDTLDVAGQKYAAVREMELDANTYFVKFVTTFTPVGHEADSMMVQLGAVTHDVLNKYSGDSWIAFTEVASDTKQPEVDGNISVAVVYDPADLADNEMVACNLENGHASIVTKEATNKPITVWTGSGWSQAGIDFPEVWTAMVGDFAYAKQNPLKAVIKR